MRTPRLRRCDGAAIDVPYKLLVSVVLMTMAAAILLPALHAYQLSEIEHHIELAVADIASAARSVHRHPGSSRTVGVDVPPAGGFRLERLSIGGDIGRPTGEASTIRWRHSGGGTGIHVVASSMGQVPITGPDGRALLVQGDTAMLVLEGRRSGPDSATYVEVRLV